MGRKQSGEGWVLESGCLSISLSPCPGEQMHLKVSRCQALHPRQILRHKAAGTQSRHPSSPGRQREKRHLGLLEGTCETVRPGVKGCECQTRSWLWGAMESLGPEVIVQMWVLEGPL